ncbi:unnamed protein product [Protopolystoma xenopodis]|uniref:Uncharacterized protein n=1 Tax=Protopolystoma xenopodis TaxID=117903 RepID=A0A448WJJ3_9PLAT|nr:unnamed protein product [Protopolystoma xenopodis]
MAYRKPLFSSTRPVNHVLPNTMSKCFQVLGSDSSNWLAVDLMDRFQIDSIVLHGHTNFWLESANHSLLTLLQMACSGANEPCSVGYLIKSESGILMIQNARQRNPFNGLFHGFWNLEQVA